MRAVHERWRVLKVFLLLFWLIFTVTLTAWWVYFGFEQISRLSYLGYGNASELVRFQKMLLWEGVTLVLCLLIGGAVIATLLYRELKQGDQLRDFFVALTHDLKTSLAAVSLQAELIGEKLTSPKDVELGNRFLADIGKLTLQLENSLMLSNLAERQHIREPIKLSSVVDTIRARFPALQVELDSDAIIYADIRAIESIFSNLCQNALMHGKANKVSISTHTGNGLIQLRIVDDGSGLSGKRDELGKRFHRHYSGSGSGIGLSLSRDLAKALGGELNFPVTEKGFCVELKLCGEPL